MQIWSFATIEYENLYTMFFSKSGLSFKQVRKQLTKPYY